MKRAEEYIVKCSEIRLRDVVNCSEIRLRDVVKCSEIRLRDVVPNVVKLG